MFFYSEPDQQQILELVTNGLIFHLDADNSNSFSGNDNLIPNSALATTVEDINWVSYTANTDNTVANPFGGFDGVLKFDVTSGSRGGGYWRRGINYPLIAGNTYTFSYYVKNGTFANIFGLNAYYFGTSFVTFSPNFQTTTISLNQSIDVGNGWYRQTMTYTPSYTQTYKIFFNYSYSPTYGNGSLYLYGFQLERGSTTSDYTPTTGTAIDKYKYISDLRGNYTVSTGVNGVEYMTSIPAFAFDGVNDYISTPIDLSWNNTNSTTISTFLRPNSLSSSGAFLGKTGWEWRIQQHTTSLYFTYWDNIGTHNNRQRISLNDFFDSTTDFVNFVISWDHINNSYAFYKNGQQFNNLTYLDYGEIDASINRNTSESIKIGGNIYNGGGYGPSDPAYWNGSLSILKIYNRALSQNEVQQNFNFLKDRYGL